MLNWTILQANWFCALLEKQNMTIDILILEFWEQIDMHRRPQEKQ
jgi:hypothetical protein